MVSIKQLKIFSFAKFQAIMATYLGLGFGILYSVGGLIVDILVSLNWVSTAETSGLSYGTVLAFGALVGMPVVFAIGGFVLGIVEAFLYNIFSKWFKAIKIEFH